MTKFLTNNFSVISLYKKPSEKSELVTQMIYGESFVIKKKIGKWLKIRIKEDNYIGFIKNKNFSDYLKPTHKVNILGAKIYKKPNQRRKNIKLSFGSKIKVLDKKGKFLKFSNGWVANKDVNPVLHRENNIFRKIKIFKNTKYKWGGKSFKGIDCSALIQVFLNFSNRFCPRDAKDQVKFFKKNIELNKIKKNDIIYWKGHVAVAISSKKLIHAYGPMKKTVIMGIKKTIKRIEQTAKLKVIAIKRL